MRRLAGPVAALVLVASCSTPPPPPSPETAAPAAAVCRIGPDGARPADDKVADRGIGGTGAPVRTADRGIGGTGIIAVITGFASVCLGGLEVGIDAATPATVDATPSSVSVLRAGQVAVVQAGGARSTLAAQRIEVRHEVIGPVEVARPGELVVAGQRVLLGSSVGGLVNPQPGQWIAVSGLRRPDGAILATRLDVAPPGRVLVHGELVRSAGGTMIGSLPVQLPDGNVSPAGWQVTVTGTLAAGVLVADSAARDRLADNPAAVFGPDVQTFVVEGYVSVVAGGLLLNRGFLGGGGFYGSGQPERAITTFRRGPDGVLGATGLRTMSGAAGMEPGRSFSPAPVPRGGTFREEGNRGGAGRGFQGMGSVGGQPGSGFGPGGGAGNGQGGSRPGPAR